MAVPHPDTILISEATPELAVSPRSSRGSCQHQTSHYSVFSLCYFSTDVGAFFEEGMWLRYNFQAPGAGGRSEGSPDAQGSPPDLTHEEVRFSFSTTRAPCILLYVSSLTTDFLAVLVKPTGKGSVPGRVTLGAQSGLGGVWVVLGLSFTPPWTLSNSPSVFEPYFPGWEPGKQLVRRARYSSNGAKTH